MPPFKSQFLNDRAADRAEKRAAAAGARPRGESLEAVADRDAEAARQAAFAADLAVIAPPAPEQSPDQALAPEEIMRREAEKSALLASLVRATAPLPVAPRAGVDASRGAPVASVEPAELPGVPGQLADAVPPARPAADVQAELDTVHAEHM